MTIYIDMSDNLADLSPANYQHAVLSYPELEQASVLECQQLYANCVNRMAVLDKIKNLAQTILIVLFGSALLIALILATAATAATAVMVAVLGAVLAVGCTTLTDKLLSYAIKKEFIKQEAIHCVMTYKEHQEALRDDAKYVQLACRVLSPNIVRNDAPVPVKTSKWSAFFGGMFSRKHSSEVTELTPLLSPQTRAVP